MTQFTLDDLRECMLLAVGYDESIDLEQDILDEPMGDLGFDSLAVMNVAREIEARYPVRVPDESLDETMATPRRTLDYINGLLKEDVAA
ncbi:acyl carrier protein [Streptosporangium sandarakinum]|uniref:acyl carrier protein n=1 Tax=Streptosporangium TaxID=2000 RepID=UPI0031F9D364